MQDSELNRRDFHRLTMAALGGALAGSVAGCGKDAAPPPSKSGASPATGATSGSTPIGKPAEGADDKLADSVAAVGVEKHVCRGLNACKNQGASGANDCAGQGTCATVDHHTCGGQNACKGQGGCGKTPLENECSGKGGCHVPLMDDAWTRGRRVFEAKMKKAGKEVGAAPAKS